jgi:hypothetical protein
MLFLLQAAAQHLPPGLPPINVTVQQPASGMPDWVKILISAGVGAVLGVGSNLLMEFVKPIIARRQMTRLVREQIVEEVLLALTPLRIVGAENERIESRRPRGPGNYASFGSLVKDLEMVSFDRYEHYLEIEKAVVYGLPEFSNLAKFRQLVPKIISMYEGTEPVSLVHTINVACEAAEKFLVANQRKDGNSKY